MMRIKKTLNNEYLLTPSKVWVRNFAKPKVSFVDINRHLYSNTDYQLYMENESFSHQEKYLRIDNEDVTLEKIAIISDGYGFEEKQKILAKIDKTVAIIAVNGGLAKWNLTSKTTPTDQRRRINFYLTNNPYRESLSDLPKERFFPRCIASSRTYPDFLSKYKGDIFTYIPTNTQNYAGNRIQPSYKIDDYRNPVCASIGLAYRFGVRKLLLFCCDASFDDYRPASIKLDNGLYAYEQQLMSQHIIDGNLHWLKQEGVEIADHSSGTNYNNAVYINEDRIVSFFEEENEGN